MPSISPAPIAVLVYVPATVALAGGSVISGLIRIAIRNADIEALEPSLRSEIGGLLTPCNGKKVTQGDLSFFTETGDHLFGGDVLLSNVAAPTSASVVEQMAAKVKERIALKKAREDREIAAVLGVCGSFIHGLVTVVCTDRETPWERWEVKVNGTLPDTVNELIVEKKIPRQRFDLALQALRDLESVQREPVVLESLDGVIQVYSSLTEKARIKNQDEVTESLSSVVGWLSREKDEPGLVEQKVPRPLKDLLEGKSAEYFVVRSFPEVSVSLNKVKALYSTYQREDIQRRHDACKRSREEAVRKMAEIVPSMKAIVEDRSQDWFLPAFHSLMEIFRAQVSQHLASLPGSYRISTDLESMDDEYQCKKIPPAQVLELRASLLRFVAVLEWPEDILSVNVGNIREHFAEGDGTYCVVVGVEIKDKKDFRHFYEYSAFAVEVLKDHAGNRISSL